MNRPHAINLIILALKAGGFNDDLRADGEIGKEAYRAVYNFKRGITPMRSSLSMKEKNNLVILALMAIGVEGSNDFVTDGTIGPVVNRCLNAFVGNKS